MEVGSERHLSSSGLLRQHVLLLAAGPPSQDGTCLQVVKITFLPGLWVSVFETPTWAEESTLLGEEGTGGKEQGRIKSLPPTFVLGLCKFADCFGSEPLLSKMK